MPLSKYEQLIGTKIHTGSERGDHKPVQTRCKLVQTGVDLAIRTGSTINHPVWSGCGIF